MSERKVWRVPYRATFRGYLSVEAKTAEEARAIVDGGGFDNDAGAEMCDWEVDGPVMEER